MNKNNWKKIFAKYRLCAAMMIVFLTVLATGCGKGKEEEAEVETPEIQQVEEPEPEPNNLEENSHASIDRLMEEYCECIANGDVDKLEKLVDVLTDEEKEKIQARSNFIEAFENISCYTKNGPVTDSYIVFLCYDMRLINIKTSAPDIVCLYVSAKDEKGDRYIHYGDASQDAELQSYVMELESDPEVKALYDDVSTRYQEAMESDEMLREYIQSITGQVSAESESEGSEGESGETSAAEESEENTGEGASDDEAEEPAEAETEQPQEAGVVNRETRVTESVNVRKEASTESERLALAYQGDKITQIESYDDGWSKVEYKGMTGYVKTEFLE